MSDYGGALLMWWLGAAGWAVACLLALRQLRAYRGLTRYWRATLERPPSEWPTAVLTRVRWHGGADVVELDVVDRPERVGELPPWTEDDL